MEKQVGTALRGVPITLFAAFEEHAAALLREYTLRGFGDAAQPYGADEIAAAGQAVAVVSSRIAAECAASGAAAAHVDVTLAGDEVAPAQFGLLQGILDDATALAASGELLVFPALPELRALRNWVCDEVATQNAGGSATAWVLPTELSLSPQARPAQWDRQSELSQTDAWIVGDDHNTIIGASRAALQLLGWDEADLVGQRIIAIIPPRLREQHLAGFTIGVVSDHHTLLGQPLALSALHRAGHEIDITLVLTRHQARHGRAVYLAELRPAAGDATPPA